MEAVRTLLFGVGEDPEREGLLIQGATMELERLLYKRHSP
jgi:GTP cyclohydrolase I